MTMATRGTQCIEARRNVCLAARYRQKDQLRLRSESYVFRIPIVCT
jgi:hypothetical protein